MSTPAFSDDWWRGRSSSHSSPNQCRAEQKASRLEEQACEIQQKALGCDKFAQQFESGSFSQGLTKSCGRRSYDVVGLGLTCAPVTLAAGLAFAERLQPLLAGSVGNSLVKSVERFVPPFFSKVLSRLAVAINVAAVPVTAYSVYDLMAEAIEQDRQCFENVEAKKSYLEFLKVSSDYLIENLGSLVTPANRQQLGFSEEYLKDGFGRNITCQRLRELGLQQKKKQDAVLGPLLASGKIKQDPRIDFKLNEEEQKALAFMLKNYSCLSPTKQVELLCALGNTVLGGVAVKNLLKDLRVRPLVEQSVEPRVSSRRAGSRLRQGMVREGDDKAERAILAQLQESQVLTPSEVVALVEQQDVRTITRLSEEGMIATQEYERLLDAFGPIVVGAPIGEAKMIAVGASAAKGKQKNVLLQERVPVDAVERSVGIFDPDSKKAIGVLEYSVTGAKYDQLEIAWVNVAKAHRQLGLSELMAESVLKARPELKTIKAALAGTNQQVLGGALAKGLSDAEAAKTIPLYRLAKRFGFSEVKLVRELDGTFSLEASRP